MRAACTGCHRSTCDSDAACQTQMHACIQVTALRISAASRMNRRCQHDTGKLVTGAQRASVRDARSSRASAAHMLPA